MRAPREARIPISAQPASASGHHGGDEAIPVLRRNACPKIATPMIETGGKTMYVPSNAQPLKNPARGPRLRPVKA